jgi:DNA (cytosine-5)-methyltransferase 1
MRAFDFIVKNRAEFFKSKKITDKTSLSDAISDLVKKNGTQESPDSKSFQAGIYSRPKSNYQKLMRQGKPLTNKIADSHRFARHRADTIERFQYILDHSKANLTISDAVRKKYNLKKHTIVPLCKESCTPTLTTLPDDYIHYSEPRILTVREYARIQSFPDSYEFKGKYTTGGERRRIDVPRYTQIGNAIPPLFSEQAGIALKEML